MSFTLIGAIPTAVVAMDLDGRITALNGAAERLLGTTSEDALGQPYPQVFGASLSDRMLPLFIRVSRSGDPGNVQLVRATLPSGRRAALRASIGPIHDSSGQVTGLVFAADDEVAETAVAAEPQATEVERLRQALQRYVGGAVAALVDSRPSFIGLGGVRQEISVLHADVRGYTTIAEALPPEEVMGLLVRYHGAAIAALRAEGATPDRFIGDAVLALWNAPAPQEGHALMAVRGALALIEATKAVGDDLAYGAGVHSGEAVVGNLGSEEYMTYTAIGDTVNVAARLQGAASPGEVLCSGAVLEQAGPQVQAAPLGPLTVKGRVAPIEAFRLEGIVE